jgi:hypothetical protein
MVWISRGVAGGILWFWWLVAEIFEPLDGFRAVAYVGGGLCRLVSRNRNEFRTFEPQAQALGRELSGRRFRTARSCVRARTSGPMFYELMRRRGPFCLYAFDLPWLASELSYTPLWRKMRMLRLFREGFLAVNEESETRTVRPVSNAACTS